jgi:hypothetical protein
MAFCDPPIGRLTFPEFHFPRQLWNSEELLLLRRRLLRLRLWLLLWLLLWLPDIPGRLPRLNSRAKWRSSSLRRLDRIGWG